VKRSTFTEPEFVEALYHKTLSYYIAADLYSDSNGDSNGKRLGKEDTIFNPLFRAIHYYRQRWFAEHQLRDFLSGSSREFRQKFQNLLRKRDKTHEERLAKAYLRAVGKGDLEELTDLFKLSELYERRWIQNRSVEQKRDSVPWLCYVGIGAFKFLARGKIPTKKEVKQEAFRLRAVAELPLDSNAQAIEARIHELRSHAPKRCARIFGDLGLIDLPSASRTG